jgi:hypothetical protein
MPTASAMLHALSKHFARAPLAAIACGIGLVLISGEARADLDSKERLTVLAKLPDWTGVWQSSIAGGSGAARSAAPANSASGSGAVPRAALPYNPTWQAKFEAAQKKLNAIAGEEPTSDNTVTQCIWGMPRIFDGPYTFEITVLPEQTFFNYDVNEYRHVWTDGRTHPPHVTPTDMGHSIGRWEGETLVVHTNGLKLGIWANSAGAILSDKASITERWSQTDKDHLKVDVVVEDPLALTKPYSATHRYQRVADTNRQLQQNCFENTHEVQEGGKVSTKFTP